MKIIEVSEAEITKPYGQVIVSAVSFEQDAYGHYTTIVADDFTRIAKGKCRSCKKKIKPYRSVYYERHYSCNSRYCFQMSMQNDYCEDCARKKAKSHYMTDDHMPPVKEVRQFVKDGETLSMRVYTDGSVMEEMTSSEAARANYKS